MGSGYRWRYRGDPADADTGGEDADPHHVMVFDGVIGIDKLLTEPPLPAETGAGWPSADSRFEVLALRLWEPILAASGGVE